MLASGRGTTRRFGELWYAGGFWTLCALGCAFCGDDAAISAVKAACLSKKAVADSSVGSGSASRACLWAEESPSRNRFSSSLSVKASSRATQRFAHEARCKIRFVYARIVGNSVARSVRIWASYLRKDSFGKALVSMASSKASGVRSSSQPVRRPGSTILLMAMVAASGGQLVAVHSSRNWRTHEATVSGSPEDRRWMVILGP